MDKIPFLSLLIKLLAGLKKGTFSEIPQLALEMMFATCAFFMSHSGDMLVFILV